MQGILFKPDMIQAIIEGRKTQTRRVIKLQSKNPYDVWYKNGIFTYRDKKNYEGGCYFSEWQHIKPRYHIGETVYIKEAYWFYRRFGTMANIKYMRDGFVTWVPIPRDKPTPKTGYHSPLMMPERVARHFIMIEQVRAERLEVITEEDAIAEGCTIMAGVTSGGSMGLASARYAYKELWDSINAKYPWESNPWVFPYTFSLKEGK